MEQVAVVILNYNGVHFLEKFLPSVVKYSRGHRVIVADNGSTDTSLSFLKTKYPEVETLVFRTNYGFARGYNEALSQIDNRYSVLLNSDVEVTEQWIEPVIALMESDSNIIACQPKVKSYHKKDYFEHAGAAGGYIDEFGYPFCRGRLFDSVEVDNGQYDTIKKIFWASGACFFVKTKLYNDLGGFDPAYHAHMEEIDFCWRANLRGYYLYTVPASVVYHVGGGTLPASNPRKTYLNFRNSTITLFKNAPSASLWIRLIIKIKLDLIAAIVFLFKGQLDNTKAVLLAVAHFFRFYQKWKSTRKELATPKQANPDSIYQGSIVVDHFLLQKKKFSELKFSSK